MAFAKRRSADMNSLRKSVLGSNKHKLTVLCKEVKFLRTFHLFARKWDNNYDDDDASLAGLIVRIEDVASEIERLHLPKKEIERLEDFLQYTRGRIDFFKQEINQWYIKLFSDCSHQSSSSSSQQQDMSSNEILEFIEDSLLGSLDFLYRKYFHHDYSAHLLDFLKEKIIFLRNFIRFTTLQLGSIIINVDDDNRGYLGNLLTHIRAVAISALHYCYMCRFERHIPNQLGWPKKVNSEMLSKISQLLQKIKPVNRQVYETYVQVLKNLSRQPHTTAAQEEDVNVSKDFINSLLPDLFEILDADTIPVFVSKDQLQILHDGLRSLRYILEINQPKDFEDNIWQLTRVVVCDAGIVIFSLFLDSIEDDLAEERNHMLFDLLERIKRITATVAVESPQGSIFNFANVDELRFVDLLLENLAELTNREAASAAIPNFQIQTISQGLVFLRNCLRKILELHDQKEELQPLWSRVMELAYRMNFWLFGQSHLLNAISINFLSWRKDYY